MSRFVQHFTNERNAEAQKEEKKKKLTEEEQEMENLKKRMAQDRDHAKRIRTAFR